MSSLWTAFRDLDPLLQALLGGGFTWLLTALGAATVLFVVRVGRAFLDAMLGFAAGVMIAASVWSLIIPALERAEALGMVPWIPVVVGFAAGGAFLFAIDRVLPHLHPGAPRAEAEGPTTTWRRSTLLISAITLHNIPEGLAVGVAFAAAAIPELNTELGAAVALALGIGIQNVPEGIAVSLPLRREGMSRLRSLWWGQLSAFVEPLAALAGAAAVLAIRPALPYALAFAAGAMIFVSVEELIPESQRSGNTDLATLGTMLGFAVMMTLDVALG